MMFIDKQIAEPDPPEGFALHGLADIVSLDTGGTDFLVLERTFVQKQGLDPPGFYGIRLYEASNAHARNVAGQDIVSPKPFPAEDAMSKHLLLDFGGFLESGTFVDNLEGLEIVYHPDCHSAILIIMADNNFITANQFLFYELTGNL
jgi:hypothetical protein